MIAKFKALGLAFVAVFAMSAVVATAAQATAGTLTTFPAGKTVDITAEQVGLHEFKLTDHEVQPGSFASATCSYAHFDGVGAISTGATQITVTPTYGTHPPQGETCIVFGQPGRITTTGCDYLLKSGTPTGGGWHVTTDLVCTGANTIIIESGTCEVHIGPQTGLTTSQVTNSGSASPETAMDLLLHIKITGIKYTVTKDSIGCPLKGTGTFTGGDYTGTTTVQATDSTTGAAVGITLH
jgi:hypothetical protein